jgi:hypothetical protein
VTRTLAAHRDPALSARIVRSVTMRYATGADASLDRPAHVRAASAMERGGGRLVVAQDDANFIALVDAESGLAEAATLPAGEGGLRQFDDGRGNKRFKLDLESCVVARGGGRETLIALGSGSTPLRERIVVVHDPARPDPPAEIVDGAALYAALREMRDFSGSEMNVEGAVVIDGTLRLFNRGNGAARDGLAAVNATCDLPFGAFLAWLADPASAPPSPANAVRYDLGEIDGHPLTFTDATVFGGRVFFTASAEDSPDAVLDGPVAGSVVGVLDGGASGRWARVVGENGEPFDGKVEAILLRDAGSAWILVDRDDPDRPSELCDVVLEGPWM